MRCTRKLAKAIALWFTGFSVEHEIGEVNEGVLRRKKGRRADRTHTESRLPDQQI